MGHRNLIDTATPTKPITRNARLDPAALAILAAQPLGLGGAPLGNLFRAVSEAEAGAVIQRAWTAGVRYFDTAPHYGQGLSETRFGRALRDHPRHAFLLSSKVGRILDPVAAAPSSQHGYVDVPSFATRHDYTRSGFERSLADSRRRLHMDRIDLVYVHDLDRDTHGTAYAGHFRGLCASGLPALAAMKADGAIGSFGIGVNSVDAALATLREADLDVLLLAGRYTLADQSALADLLPECARRGVTVVLGGVFNSGILATGTASREGGVATFDYAPAAPAVLARVAALEAVCATHAVPLPAAALQFAGAHPVVAATLAGARSVAELDAILAWRRCAIPPAFWDDVRARGLVDPMAPLPAGAP